MVLGPDAVTLTACPPAPWRSGYAAACKAVYTGSIPVGASRSDYLTWTVRGGRGQGLRTKAEVELATSLPGPGVVSVGSGT